MNGEQMENDIHRHSPVREEHDLKEILNRLIQAYEPEAIYLFGSKARGDAGPDSDYDLLLVVPDDARQNGGAADLHMRLCGVQARAERSTRWSARVRISTRATISRHRSLAPSSAQDCCSMASDLRGRDPSGSSHVVATD